MTLYFLNQPLEFDLSDRSQAYVKLRRAGNLAVGRIEL